ncbi:O-antigen ligase family protein [Haloferula sp.]|uniref:O-antigen ligase family protein n=1 Tax=Haloferula sp. TaxID=2497595 RepID=UPI00329CA080
MKTASSIFLVISLWLAVIFGGQTEAWSWGPSMLALGVAVLLLLTKKPDVTSRLALWFSLFLAVSWIALRSMQSPVVDFARADFMLVIALAGFAWIICNFKCAGREMRIFHVGLAMGVIANVAMAMIQWRSPEAMWPYSYRPTMSPTGFFGHYNYFANFVVGSSLLLVARALFGVDKAWQRVLYACAFLGTAVVVPLSGSRGGLVAFGFGTVLVLFAAAVIGWRSKRRWLPAVLIAIPVTIILGATGSWLAIKSIQEHRGQGDSVVSVVDNSARLEWMQLALQTAGDHPMQGGGSRSYSWERNAKWDPEELGVGQQNEPFVHNELLQLATDYGWIGAITVMASLIVLAGINMSGLFVGSSDKELERKADPIHVGVIAAGGAMLLQANFSFVFHMLPSVLLLGVMFGLTASTGTRLKESHAFFKWALYGTSVLLVSGLFHLGWKGAKTLRLLWPVLYAERSLMADQPNAAMASLEAAAQEWGGYRVLEEKGSWARVIISDQGFDGEEARNWNSMAADAYRRAWAIHPSNPVLALNLGNTCSDLGLNEEAEDSLEKAIELQGGLEAGFRSNYYLAQHLFKVWQERWMKERRSEEALAQFIRARELLEVSDSQIWKKMSREADPLRKGITESIEFLEGAGVRPAEINR